MKPTDRDGRVLRPGHRGARLASLLLAAFALLAALPATALASQTLTVEKEGTGTGKVTSSPAGISCDPTCSFSFADNAVVLLTGTPGTNTAAVAWSGCDSITVEKKCKVTMSAAKTIKATFNLAKRKLTVTKAGTGTGTVKSSPAGIECGATCSAEYDHGTEVTLTGVAGANTEAVKWAGCTSVVEGNCKVTMTAAKSVTATFNLKKVELKVAKGGLGTGEVTSSPAGIKCGMTCAFVFNEGATVTLTGTPSGETQPVKWSGCDSVNAENKCVLTMSGAREVGALFNVEGPTLTISKAGNGTGTVTSSPAALDCGGACAVNFVKDTKVTLTGTPGLHTQPVKWAGCDEIAAEGKCVVTMSAARQVSATFALEPQWVEYALSIGLKGTGKGTVQSSPAGIECPSDCAQPYVFKTQVNLTATPAPGSELDHWSIAACGSSPVCSITLKSDRTVNAVFVAVGTRTLNVAKAGSGQGIVTSANVGGIECGAACAAELDVKAKVVLTAIAQVGSTFTGWSGEGCKGIKNCRVTMNEARNVTATFSANPTPPAPKCRVPRLRGKTLPKARSALYAHNCSLGRLKKPKGKGTLVVRSSKPGAGAVRPAGARVSLKLVRRHR